MISAIIPFVLSVVTVATPTPAPAAAGADPAIKVTVNHQTFNRGDRARVTVRVGDDGYVVVLHEDADGHVRVLFPVDPGDDNFLKAGQDYEIRGRGDRDAFQVTAAGTGTVYAAVAMDPYHLDDFVRNDHWDYGKLDDDSAATNDPEATMTSIVEQMADGNHFDYDVTTYTAEAPYASNGGQAYIVPSAGYGCFYGSWDPWCDGFYPSPSYFDLNFGFGFGGFRGFRGFRGDGFGFPRFGFGFGFPIFINGHHGRGFHGRGYGSAGYGYAIGHGWSYNHRPIILGPGGGHFGGTPGWGLGSSVGYRNRGSFVNNRGTSPLYGVSRFNTQRGPSRGIESTNRFGGRRDGSISGQGGFRTRIGNSRTWDQSGMRPTRVEGAGVSHANGGSSRPTRVEPRGDSRPTRVEPRSEPRSQPRAEPRSGGRSPEAHGGGSRSGGPRGGGGSHGGGSHGGGGGGGGRRGGGGGGGGGHHH